MDDETIRPLEFPPPSTALAEEIAAVARELERLRVPAILHGLSDSDMLSGRQIAALHRGSIRREALSRLRG